MVGGKSKILPTNFQVAAYVHDTLFIFVLRPFQSGVHAAALIALP